MRFLHLFKFIKKVCKVLSDTKWDELVIDKRTVCEYVLCPADRGAGEIDGVYLLHGRLCGN